MDINKLIKLAKSYDTVGLYHEADKIMIKLAQSLPPPKPFSEFRRDVVLSKYGNVERLILPPAEYIGSDKDTKIEYRRYNYFRNQIYSYLKVGNIPGLRRVFEYLKTYNLDAFVDGEHSVLALSGFLNDFLDAHDKVIKENNGQIVFHKGTMPNEVTATSFAITSERLWLDNKANGDSLKNVFKTAKNGPVLDSSSAAVEGIPRDKFNEYVKLLNNKPEDFILNFNKDYSIQELTKNGNTYTSKLRNISNTPAASGTAASGSGAAAKPEAPQLADPKNPVQISQPVSDPTNVYQNNLNRLRPQETNKDALRSEWNGYIQGDSFLQSLESRLKDIHNQVNPNNQSQVFNEGMIATIESKGPEYKPLIDMYKARKINTYKNVGDLGPAEMYGTK